jgi:formate dehydrogenase subunit gamma
MAMTEQHKIQDSDPGPDAVTQAVDRICGIYRDKPDALIEIFHDLQDALGHVPEAALKPIAKRLNLSRAEVHGVLSFYHDFHTKPAGRVVVKICRAEACQSMGALPLIERICDRLGVPMGGTSDGGSVTVEPVYCLGNCALAPAAMVGGVLHGRVNAERVVALVVEMNGEAG